MHRSLLFTFQAVVLLCSVPALTLADTSLCGNSQYISRNNGQLIFLTNAWNPSDPGFQCISLSDNDDQFNATWQWGGTSRDTVHSYPHIRYQPTTLPVPITTLNNLTLSGTWSIHASTKDLDSATTGMVANAAWDMFGDEDQEVSMIDSQARWEVMIWMGRWGNPDPIGKPNCLADPVTIGNDVFSLWCGQNPRPNLTTFSWVSQNNVTTFNHDYSPLFQALINSGKLPNNIYLGVVGFGQEAFTAPDNVTISISNFGVTIDNASASSSLGIAFSFDTRLLCFTMLLWSHMLFWL